ncbi:MAG TPA: PDZ domain-containing protein [Acidimicrobiia bacterium]
MDEVTESPGGSPDEPPEPTDPAGDPSSAGGPTPPPVEPPVVPPWPPAPPGSDAPRRRSSGSRLVVTLVTVLGVFVAAVGIWGFVHHPGYDQFLPGDAEAVGPLITVRGAPQYKSHGDELLVYVRERSDLNEWQYLWAKTFRGDSDIEQSPPPSEVSSSQQDTCDMDTSQVTAKFVALSKLGYKVPAKPGVVIESVLDATIPAAQQLTCLDIIHSVDGQPTETPDALHAAIAKHKPGDFVDIGFDRGGRRMTRSVKLTSDQGQALIGVEVGQIYTYPIDVSIDTSQIGGPSAGLAMTLAILDQMTKGNLTGGKRVAVTGTINPDGSVGEIGEIRLKALAVAHRDAQIFIVPACTLPAAEDPTCKPDLAAARKNAKGVKVIPVKTLDDALRALQENGGDPLPKVVPKGTTAASQ